MIYRIARWPDRPDSVEAIGSTLTVNQGGTMEQAEHEAAAAGIDASSWFYAADNRRLVVKVVP